VSLDFLAFEARDDPHTLIPNMSIAIGTEIPVTKMPAQSPNESGPLDCHLLNGDA
jgi:hypothetical protein